MNEQKCFSKEHEDIKSTCYCAECKIYMCKKCESLHSQLFKYHKQYYLDKDKDISKIFTGFCKEKDHLEKLEFFCKNHNKLCCASCIIKIKKEGKGEHADCDICLIEDIKDEKHKNFENNLRSLENLSKNIDGSIKELKNMFQKIIQSKDELKIKVQKIFTEIRNEINEREDDIFLEIDKLYENTYINEKTIKEIDNLPNNIKYSLEKGNLTNKEWNNEEKLSSLLNDCINIENNIANINKSNELIKKSKDDMKTVIKFYPEEKNEITILLKKIKTFGDIYIDNISNIKENENNYIDIDIKSTNRIEPNRFSLELKGFSSKNYNNYYPKEIEYKDNFIFTICLEGKNKESLDAMIDIFNKDPNSKTIYSIRIDNNNKIFIDFKGRNSNISEIIDYCYQFDINLNEIFCSIYSNLDLKNLLKMNLDEFFLNLCSVIISMRCRFKHLQKLLLFFEEKTDEITKKEEEKKEVEEEKKEVEEKKKDEEEEKKEVEDKKEEENNEGEEKKEEEKKEEEKKIV